MGFPMLGSGTPSLAAPGTGTGAFTLPPNGTLLAQQQQAALLQQQQATAVPAATTTATPATTPLSTNVAAQTKTLAATNTATAANKVRTNPAIGGSFDPNAMGVVGYGGIPDYLRSDLTNRTMVKATAPAAPAWFGPPAAFPGFASALNGLPLTLNGVTYPASPTTTAARISLV